MPTGGDEERPPLVESVIGKKSSAGFWCTPALVKNTVVAGNNSFSGGGGLIRFFLKTWSVQMLSCFQFQKHMHISLVFINKRPCLSWFHTLNSKFSFPLPWKHNSGPPILTSSIKMANQLLLVVVLLKFWEKAIYHSSNCIIWSTL